LLFLGAVWVVVAVGETGAVEMKAVASTANPD
jgi:hypothetical protein